MSLMNNISQPQHALALLNSVSRNSVNKKDGSGVKSSVLFDSPSSASNAKEATPRHTHGKKILPKTKGSATIAKPPQSRRDAFPGFMDGNAGVLRQPVKCHPSDWYRDGEDHVNIWTGGSTTIGTWLDREFVYNWSHPILGGFASLSAFEQFMISATPDPRIRMMRGRQLREYAQRAFDNQATLAIPSINAIILDAAFQRIVQFPEFIEHLQSYSDLPFDCYSVRNDTGETRRPVMASWFVPGMEMVRYAVLNNQYPDLDDYKHPEMRGLTIPEILRECGYGKTIPAPRRVEEAKAPTLDVPKKEKSKPVKAEKKVVPEKKATTGERGLSVLEESVKQQRIHETVRITLSSKTAVNEFVFKLALVSFDEILATLDLIKNRAGSSIVPDFVWQGMALPDDDVTEENPKIVFLTLYKDEQGGFGGFSVSTAEFENPYERVVEENEITVSITDGEQSDLCDATVLEMAVIAVSEDLGCPVSAVKLYRPNKFKKISVNDEPSFDTPSTVTNQAPVVSDICETQEA